MRIQFQVFGLRQPSESPLVREPGGRWSFVRGRQSWWEYHVGRVAVFITERSCDLTAVGIAAKQIPAPGIIQQTK